MLIIIHPKNFSREILKTYKTQEEFEKDLIIPIKNEINKELRSLWNNIIGDSFYFLKIGATYYRTYEDEKSSSFDRFIKIQYIISTYNKFFAYLTVIEEVDGVISLNQGYCDIDHVLDSCTVEIDRIPEITRKKIIELINI